MNISIELPLEVENSLRLEHEDVGLAIKEAALVELYRQDKISLRDLSQTLGISRLEADGILKKHNVTEDFPSDDEIMQALRRLGVQ